MAYLCSDNYSNDFGETTVLFDDKEDAKAWVKKRRAQQHQRHCIDRPEPEKCYCKTNSDGVMCWYHDPKFNPAYNGHTAKECGEVKPCIFYDWLSIH